MAREAREKLREAGFEVISRWIDLPDDTDTDDDDYKREQAEIDIEDLFNADVLVLLNITKSEGKACEVGMCIASGIPVICVGSRQNNVFLHLPEIFQVNDLDNAIEVLKTFETINEQLLRETAQQQGFLEEPFIISPQSDA